MQILLACLPEGMISQASRLLISRIHLPWRQFFQGRYLIVTNTLGGGLLMALGDCLQQSREIHLGEGRVRNWRRTGEKRVRMEPEGIF